MSSTTAGSGGATTVATTTLPDGTRRVVTTTVLPNGTRTTTQLLPSIPAVKTETIRRPDGSGSTVRKTTSVVYPGGRREVRIEERFAPAPAPPSAATGRVAAAAGLASSSTNPAPSASPPAAAARVAAVVGTVSSTGPPVPAPSPPAYAEGVAMVASSTSPTPSSARVATVVGLASSTGPAPSAFVPAPPPPDAAEQAAAGRVATVVGPTSSTNPAPSAFVPALSPPSAAERVATVVGPASLTGPVPSASDQNGTSASAGGPSGRVVDDDSEDDSWEKFLRMVSKSEEAPVDPVPNEDAPECGVAAAAAAERPIPATNPTSSASGHDGAAASSPPNRVVEDDPVSLDHDEIRACAAKLLQLANKSDETRVGNGDAGRAKEGEMPERAAKVEPEIAQKPAEKTPAAEEPKPKDTSKSDDAPRDTAEPASERESLSGATKFRSGWSSTPKVPKAQSFVPVMAPTETAVQRRRREEREAREAAAQREREKEEARRQAEEKEVGRLERERLERERLAAERAEAERLERERQAAVERAEAERLEMEKMAAAEAAEAARRAELERAAKQAELDRLEQERIDHEMALAEQQRIDASSIRIAAPVGTVDLAKAEEGAAEPSPTVVAAVQNEFIIEESEPQKSWWQRNKCRCSSLLLLLLIAAILGLALGLRENDDGASVSSAGGTGGAVIQSAGNRTNDDDTDAPIALVVDRTCEYRKSGAVYVSVIDNGVNNGMYGGISDFDGNSAVVVSTKEGGIGAVWALSKSGGSWSQTAFQTDSSNRFGWDVAISRDTIVVGAPDEGKRSYQEYGRGAAAVLARDSGGSWYSQGALSPKIADSDSEFGISVDISDCGCYIAVGAWRDRDGRGSVYVYSKIGGKWNETQKISPTYARTTGNYGHTVAISDKFLAVKAPFDYKSGRRGVVHLYKRASTGLYVEIERLSAPDGPHTETYHSPQVVLLDDFVLVGAPEYGKVYVFKPNSSGGYQKTTELTASDATLRSNFGIKIGGRGADVLVSDRSDDSTYLFSYEDGVWKEKAKFEGYHAALSGKSIVVHSPFEFNLYGSRYGGQVRFYDLVCE